MSSTPQPSFHDHNDIILNMLYQLRDCHPQQIPTWDVLRYSNLLFRIPIRAGNARNSLELHFYKERLALYNIMLHFVVLSYTKCKSVSQQ